MASRSEAAATGRSRSTRRWRSRSASCSGAPRRRGWHSSSATRAHVDYEGDVPYDKSLRAAVARGIRIHAVAASGLRDEGTVVFRQIAQFTRGEFVFVEYGKDVQASARAHRVAGAVAGNDLGEILFARIRDEAFRWGRSEGPATVAR